MAAGTAAAAPPETPQAAVTAVKAMSATFQGVLNPNAAGNQAGEETRGLPVSFTAEPAQPTVEPESPTGVSATSATLRATVNPNGAETTCRFEYGTSTAYGSTVACEAALGAGRTPVAVSRPIAGLASDTTYHWRISATSAGGTSVSADQTFIYPTTGEGLPDGRAYEMVTPPHKNAALIGVFFNGLHPDISEGGSRVILSSIQCYAGAESCTATRQIEGEQVLFSRTSGGWVTTALAPPASQFEVSSSWMASAEAGTALFSAPTPPANEDDFYVRRPDGSLGHIGPATPPALGALGPTPWGASGMAATADFSHVLFQEEFLWTPQSTGQLPYELVGTGNTAPLVVAVSGGPGSTDLISACGAALGGSTTPLDLGSMSADGKTVFFAAGSPGCFGTGANEHTEVPVNTVYARIDGEQADAHTVAVSVRSPGNCTGACATSTPHDAQFMGASTDASKVYFTSTQQLTNEAGQDNEKEDDAFGSGCSTTVGPNGCNLYEYDFGRPAQNLIDVSSGDTSGHGPRVRGVFAVSDDGSHVYFVAAGVLTHTSNDQGKAPQDGANNLYVYERDASYPGGRVSFITALPKSDESQWSQGPGNEVNVTPSGRFLVFASHGSLTPDDTRPDGALQVFRYDASTGELVRISVGERGFNDNGNHSSITPCVENAFCPDSASIANSNFGHAGPARRDPTMSHDGSYIFFESPVGLTPHALDELQIGREGEGRPVFAENIYEWHSGHVYLISDGRDASVIGGGAVQPQSTVSLVGSDATGANVFFTTADKLVQRDTDTQVDFYDARICEPEHGNPCISEPPPPLPPCAGEQCHGTPAATPGTPVTPTATFNGPGNLAPSPGVGSLHHAARSRGRAHNLARALSACRRRRNRHQRAACKAAAHRHYGVHRSPAR